MKIILLKDVKKLGRKYDVKDVADGYAINSLIPNKTAVPATPAYLKSIEEKKKQTESIKENFKKSIENAIKNLKEGKLVIIGKVNDKGSLFAAIHDTQIIDTFKKETGITIEPNFLQIEKPIKEVGEHQIILDIDGIKYKLKIEIKSN